MAGLTVPVLITAFIVILATGDINAQQKQSTPVPRAASTVMPIEDQEALLRQYCQGCHNDNLKRGEMSLTSLDLAHVDRNPELAEKIVRKLKTGLMPPASSRRPDAEQVKTFVKALETELDKAAGLRPNPGTRPFQRLTRDEYARTTRDLLLVEVDVAKYLPADTVSDGLDNIADSQAFSASLTEGYMRAAAQISREALGDPKAEAASTVFKLPRTGSQLRHVPGAPIGTRGGISVMFNFPADGEYNFRSLFHGNPTGQLFGNIPEEQLEISIDGERIALLNIDLNLSETRSDAGLNLHTGKIPVKAGPHRVSAAFLQKHSDIVEDIVAELEHTLVDTDIAKDRELTVYPHLREFEITGPYNVSGVSDNPARRKVFICRPLGPAEELPCATKIITELARQAYRRPVNSEDMEGLMVFYEQGRKKGGFEAGIRTALQAILTSPDFLFKLEPPPSTVKPGQSYRVGDVALASRLSYFLWGTLPDDELTTAATQGRLKDPVVLEKQVRRMLADPRSMWLSTKFATQWLHLRDILDFHPDPFYYPQFDYTLAQSLMRETELFFDSVVREDRNVLDLLTADYTFADDRVALHYGVPNVRGGEFRKVTLTEDYRRGLLGKGAILALTSIADRTSPVLRGKWVMGVLLGTPPPPPPANVPPLEQTKAVASNKILTVRERMEMHRANSQCNSCHQMIDPIGLALENFDVTGEWRTWDKTYAINSEGQRVHTDGIPIDSTTKLYDGTPLDGPASLRNAILKYSDAFIETLTEKLLAYAIGRRVEYFDMPTVRTITRDAAKNSNRFSSLVLGIVKSPAFQMNRVEAETSTAAERR
ncbi:MAG: DUF1592 domain-containing protein [Acidobacteria bacterium]|nr:DUF1592 domain-containing protein [Acidobacteriota bacterium]